MSESVEFDLDLIRRYDSSGPRYTSYPTAVEFSPEVGEAEYLRRLRASNASGRPLSLYFHIPFCAHVCYYCACNKIVTADRGKAEPYLDYLFREIRLRATAVEPGRPVTQLHWGGGTPTFLNENQMRELMHVTRENFTLLDDDSGEYSIEIDPREVRDFTLAVLRGIGFNRLSLGVQDFDPAVQKAVHRIQPEDMTLQVLEDARVLGFRSINIDLMYGLPLQTQASFESTLDKVIEARPDRLSVFNYAHLPERFKPQRRIEAADLPAPEVKLAILQMTIEKLTAAGYQYIGMDHFALLDDELAVAQREGTLRRNFQGYSTHADTDLIAMGVSAISAVADSFSQNHLDLEAYYADLEQARLPIRRGYELDADDVLRADVIQQLVCHGRLDMKEIAETHGIDFADYFEDELRTLRTMEGDGLLKLGERHIEVLPRGRLLIRNLCRVFDRYRQESEKQFSKMI